MSAWLLHAAAWFLPVVTGVKGGEIGPSLPGWLAFLMACRAIWPSADTFFDTKYETALAIVSVVTTLFFIVGSPWVALRGSRSLRRASAWTAATAFVVNAHWYVLRGSDRWLSDLGVGYFLWWFSFVVLAISLFDLAGRNNATESTPKHVALLPR
jgi:hypothetical protein